MNCPNCEETMETHQQFENDPGIEYCESCGFSHDHSIYKRRKPIIIKKGENSELTPRL